MAINPNNKVPFAGAAAQQQMGATVEKSGQVHQSDMRAIAEQQGMTRSWVDQRIDESAAAVEPQVK